MPTLDEPTSIELPELFDRAARVSDGAPPTLQLLIDGEWRGAQSGETFEVSSPIDDNTIAVAQAAGKDDVEAAIAAACRARSRFREMTAAERLEVCKRAGEIMAEHFETFIDAIVVDLGKTPSQAKSEATASRERLELVREEVRKIFGEYLPG